MIPISRPYFSNAEKENLNKCIDTGWVSSAGEFIPEFEKINAEYYNRKYGIAVSNGTVALHLALVALDIGQGDEVIVPNLTFAATINSVIYTGAIPAIADVDIDSWTISIESCEQIVNARTKAIIPVHLYGQPVNMKSLVQFAEKYNLYIIEDCAEAHGAKYDNHSIGSFGDISCFSFYGNKIITTGEGGMCLCDDEKLYQRINILKDHGMNPNHRYWHQEIGYNYRMTNMQAAIGVAQMEQINSFLILRANIGKRYDSALNNHPLIELQHSFPKHDRVNWLYSILIKTNELDVSIADIQKSLKKHKIDSRPFFVPLTMMKIYSNYRSHSFSNSESIYKRGICLPTYSSLTESQIGYISNCLLNILG